MVRALLLPLACFIISVQAQTIWDRTLVMNKDLKVEIRWNTTETDEDGGELDFEIFAPTSGYIGVGFSGNGAMRGSDIVVGWVDAQGQGHLKDFHGIGNEIPVLDKEQNYELIEASETPEGTTIRFRRKLTTCDEDDFQITNNTARVMWSFGKDDPKISGDSVIFGYHGADNRGVKSVYMLDPPLIAPFPDQIPDPDPSIQHWDVRANNVTHSESTLYHCSIVKFPKHQKKHHMIGYRPLIAPEKQKFVHHIVLYECVVPDELGGTAATFEKHLDHEGGRCYSPNMPPEWFKSCVGFFLSWVSGGEGEMFPEHVGSPIGLESGASTYFMFEIHYDNPKGVPVTDNSGVRIFYTDNLRENDGNVLLVSYRITPFLLIPPKQERFTTVGICSRECTEATFPKEGIKVVSVLLHAHLAARSLRLRHFRNGTELKPIADDKSYDFNYQQTRFFREEVTVLPGDELVTECDFNTEDRGRSTLGGLSTKEEMCQSFVMYYPRVEVALCSSQYEFDNFFHNLGIDNVTGEVFSAMNVPYNPNLWSKEKQKFEPTDNAKDLESLGGGKNFTDVFDLMNIEAPERLKNKSVGDYLQSVDWKNNRLSKKLQRRWQKGKHYAYCTAHGRKRIPLKEFVIDYPKYAKKPPQVDEVCAA